LTCRNGEAQLGLDLFEQLKRDGIDLNPTIVGCLTGKFLARCCMDKLDFFLPNLPVFPFPYVFCPQQLFYIFVLLFLLVSIVPKELCFFCRFVSTNVFQ
jgi:hypothetical protein